jgi:hypothetical protein
MGKFHFNLEMFFVAEDEKPSLGKKLKWTWTCSSRSWWIMIIMKKSNDLFPKCFVICLHSMILETRRKVIPTP